jgi:hypothetical protein
MQMQCNIRFMHDYIMHYEKVHCIVLIVRMRQVPFASFESFPLCSNLGAYFTRVFLQNKWPCVDNNNSVDTSVGL